MNEDASVAVTSKQYNQNLTESNEEIDGFDGMNDPAEKQLKLPTISIFNARNNQRCYDSSKYKFLFK